MEEQSSETEPLTCGIWCSLQVDSVRIELNCRTPSWCLELCFLLVWGKSIPLPHLHTYTLELSPGTLKIPVCFLMVLLELTFHGSYFPMDIVLIALLWE